MAVEVSVVEVAISTEDVEESVEAVEVVAIEIVEWSVLAAVSVTVNDVVRVAGTAVAVAVVTEMGMLRHAHAEETRRAGYVVGSHSR